MADFTFPWGSPEPKPKDGIYFTSKNSELDELQEELESMKIPRQKEAMKEIIAGMTIGKDVCPLFPYVVNCMRTKDVELKKLIYLYIINFAKAKPSDSILAVNSFLVDAADPKSPMIRALSIRTMGCIRVDEIVSYLCDTLKNGLRDPDAYVKKTSCICVAKLFCTCPQLVKDNGLIDTLISMLDDGNAIVLASAIVALSEISLLSGENYLKINSKTLPELMDFVKADCNAKLQEVTDKLREQKVKYTSLKQYTSRTMVELRCELVQEQSSHLTALNYKSFKNNSITIKTLYKKARNAEDKPSYYPILVGTMRLILNTERRKEFKELKNIMESCTCQ